MKEGVNEMFKVIEYNGRCYEVSYSKYMHFMAFSKAIVNTAWSDDEKKAVVERYLNTLIN